MQYWRITKYNPKFRDIDGRYLKDEWTAFSDIGCVYDGIEFKYSAYLEVESSYIDTIMSIMSETEKINMKIEGLELYRYKKNYEFDDVDKEKF